MSITQDLKSILNVELTLPHEIFYMRSQANIYYNGNNNGNLQWHFHGVALHPLFPDRIRIWSVDFCGGRKTGEPGEKPLEQGREPTTMSTHM